MLALGLRRGDARSPPERFAPRIHSCEHYTKKTFEKTTIYKFRRYVNSWNISSKKLNMNDYSKMDAMNTNVICKKMYLRIGETWRCR